MMFAGTHTSFESAEKRCGDWCVGGRQYQATINPTPTEARIF